MKLVSNIAHTQLSLHSMRKPEEVGYYSPIDRFSGCKSIPAKKEHDREEGVEARAAEPWGLASTLKFAKGGMAL